MDFASAVVQHLDHFHAIRLPCRALGLLPSLGSMSTARGMDSVTPPRRPDVSGVSGVSGGQDSRRGADDSYYVIAKTPSCNRLAPGG